MIGKLNGHRAERLHLGVNGAGEVELAFHGQLTVDLLGIVGKLIGRTVEELLDCLVVIEPFAQAEGDALFARTGAVEQLLNDGGVGFGAQRIDLNGLAGEIVGLERKAGGQRLIVGGRRAPSAADFPFGEG